ncbi:hypothetical protein GCM10011497_06320 [Elstera cyanobacteriorum]|uniref:Uncharacterized protein n=1 Tax=Elstera cyanobacteriorum TaxID=2022747 RepID=A0A255XY67_9PROT|nr:hypothetical protein [Elstera cyanobacteriorum]OYQ21335.1 hypothetical protein CHR90_02315 [Elstera cyanobacteriorum]OYQ21343.1 hypothetical protein CHR90_02360 [Elstera cyanobacteriorum]GFZ80606.1 hypothetical protein GCM10011497_06320 [Elstera cyanobacteriorum]
MEGKILQVVGQVAGIGGLALAVMLFLFKDIIRKNIFPKLPPGAAERILTLLIRGVLLVTLVGMGLWVLVVLAGPKS